MPFLCVGPLIRAASSTSVAIWAELSEHCTVKITVTPENNHTDTTPISVQTSTVQVDSHFYVLAQIQGLQPASWYSYILKADTEQHILHIEGSTPLQQYFRTLSTNPDQSPLRLAYGSCRKADPTKPDTLSAFGSWLQEKQATRDADWPHLLLLIGDQIYADEPPPVLFSTYPQLQDGATQFADFAILYQYAWAHDDGVRQALASIPTYMIFDDHEILNNWNVSPSWRAEAIRAGQTQTLIDGLLAYWVYQGWGNYTPGTDTTHPLSHIMDQGRENKTDVGQELRALLRKEIFGQSSIAWHYTIPTTPAIFVMNARTERTASFSTTPHELNAPTEIMNSSQMDDLQEWLQQNTQGPGILASSVPVLLPPAIGLLEYIAGLRPLSAKSGIASIVGNILTKIQQRVIDSADFDHWPIYNRSWQRLLKLLQGQHRDMLLLSGDVHFSYALQARFLASNHQETMLYQLVSTPLQNELDASSLRKLKIQSRINQTTYSGLHTKILPFKKQTATATIDHNLLFENAIAFVTVEKQTNGKYHFQQIYAGSRNGKLEILGQTQLDESREQ
ncbi:MAG TPA: alkaline phosphatase D family protein [Dictyobacter sp.]|nr:alkaline phosphatase D family protein [Dictyobacter sp.]